jgi:translocation and assembly module TamA
MRRWLALFLVVMGVLGAEQAYELSIEGVDGRVRSLFDQLSQLVQQQEQEGAITYALLYHRAQADAQQLTRVLQAFGFYSARTSFEIQAEPHWGLVLRALPGPAYPLTQLRLVPASGDEGHELLESLVPWLCIPLDRPLQSQLLIDAEAVLRSQLACHGYPLAKVLERRIELNPSACTATATLIVEMGPRALFGLTQVSGTQCVDPCFIVRSLWWAPGECYNQQQIRQTQETLEASELFTTVAITHGDALDECGLLPMSIAVTEAKPRSIGLAVSYSTYDHWGGNISWTHRNLSGMGNQLIVDLQLTQKLQELTTTLRWPNWVRPHQTLVWTLNLIRDQTPYFHERSGAMELYLQRRFSYWLTGKLGGEFNVMRATGSNDSRRFWLIGLPASLTWNHSDYHREPRHGWFVDWQVRPYMDLDSAYPTFVRQTFTSSFTWAMDCRQRFLLVPSLHVGSIAGSSQINVPPPLRFYAGNAQYMRGYNWMSVSPLTHGGEALGGRSIFVVALEPRLRLTQNLEYVFIHEWGNVWSEALPQLDRKLLRSLGVGLRYHSMVGPLRIEVAFPLDRRHGIDKPLQVYFSVGGTF